MGCVYAKPLAVEDSSKDGLKEQKILASNSSRAEEIIRLKSTRKEDQIRPQAKFERGNEKVSSFGTECNVLKDIHGDQIEKKKREMVKSVVSDYPGKGRVAIAGEGEEADAGWPIWLVAAAGEAVKGWTPRRADTFKKLEKIGQGTYSSVYKARDLIHEKLVALKRVKFDNLDTESVKFMAREILILRRLNHPNIIKLEGLIASPRSSSLYLVFEYMEHDLMGLASRPGVKFTEPQIKCYMQQLLRGLDYCHDQGVLHRDIKGSNLLIDDKGLLKIADFGLASFYDPENGAPFTSRVVTLWYRPPELLLGVSLYGVAVDLWSVGCILAELYTGKPFLPGKTEVEQLHKIFKLCGSPTDDYWRKLQLRQSTVFKPAHPYRRCVAELLKDYPPAAVALVDTLLSIEPAKRGTAASALKSQFFTSKPFACDPSSLPKYPPNKEIDSKILNEIRRQEDKSQNVNMEGRQGRESKDYVGPNTKHEFGEPRRHGHSSSVSRSEQPVSGLLVPLSKQNKATEEESRESRSNRLSHSGPLIDKNPWIKPSEEPTPLPTRASLSTLSGLVAKRISTSEDVRNRAAPPRLNPINQRLKSPESMIEMELTRKLDRKRYTHRVADSYQIENQTAHAKEATSHYPRAKAKKIYTSGPLLGPSDNVEQILKERDRQIQEFARHARNSKVHLVTGVRMHASNHAAR